MTHAWSRIEPAEYKRLDLRAHGLLEGVPLHDVWRVDLPGGGPERTIEDVRSLFATLPHARELGLRVRGLFRLRSLLGRWLRWDERADSDVAGVSLPRLTAEDRRQSLVEPGTPHGPFRVLYVRPMEALSEVRNATVHAFSVLALRPSMPGYRLFWAIYVKPLGLITPIYMRLIDPFRRLLVYPSILRHIHRSWLAAYGSSPDHLGGASEYVRDP